MYSYGSALGEENVVDRPCRSQLTQVTIEQEAEGACLHASPALKKLLSLIMFSRMYVKASTSLIWFLQYSLFWGSAFVKAVIMRPSLII